MEDFVVSARKYRPKTFDTVVGQEKITQTLIRSIENNHLAQAFLFCGPRGVGKTTCARIMARTVNQHNDPNARIDDDFSFNIFELDAASNNSVDDIRSLIDQVRIPPQIGKYKVYIIDEVHMLSTSAFNAFLKTLEEPPPYAIFILATTEKHKVLPTILSRCQIFDFNRIQIPEMVDHLSKIAARENIKAGSDALHVIAEKADGALRDALSIFDQMVSFSGNELTYQSVIEHLNILDHDYYFSITDAFIRGDRTEVLLTFNQILNKGFDGHNFVNGLASHIRNLLFSVTPETAKLLEVGETIRDRYMEQSRKCDTKFLLNAINVLSEADVHYKASRNPRLMVEINLLKISSLTGKIEEKKNDFDSVAPSAKSEQTTKPDPSSVTSAPKPSPATADQTTGSKDISAQSEAREVPKPEEKTENPVIIEPKRQETESLISAADETPELKVPENNTAEGLNSESPEPYSETTSGTQKPEAPNLAEPEPVKKGFSSRLGSAKVKGMSSINAGNGYRTGNYSADGTKDGNEDPLVDPSLPVSDKPAKDFNMAQLWEAWDAYALTIKESDRQSYYATLTKRKPILRDNFKIELLLDNEIQKGDLETDKGNLLGFIREKLNNWQIQLQGIIDEDEAGDDMDLYSPEAKFKAMAEINPAITTMKQLFDLEVDYDD
jgi:DNA polymerase-3 subunit gamma/tau